MFNKKKQPPLKSLIAAGTHLLGDMAFSEGLRVECQVTGNLTAQEASASILVIAETAVVDGNIGADHIIINGAVNGSVHAKMLLELQPKARIRGDVTYGALEMHEGALIDGRLTPLLPEEKHALKLAASNA
ncbi:MAG: polymer-forming cytoskeletal protein [Betaproteobacteria bacterium]|jgi:cytoskeletal protein CcmA (bactofilin family)|nr:polymer-forming cytoskeletal protein [Betaproteobacteria bacterium]